MGEANRAEIRQLRNVVRSFKLASAALASVLLCGVLHADDTKPQSFAVLAEPVFKQLSPKNCWFHPRVAPLPGYGKDGQPAVIMTIQKHLAADDHYSGLYFLRTNDLGKTWSGPTEIPELAWQQGENNETLAVCDVTPGWHTKSGKLIAIGIKLRYSHQGAQLLDKPRSHECAYATYDPKADKWTSWKMLAMPETDGKFFLVAPGCVQWLDKADGTLLVPIYFKGRSGSDYQVTVLHCNFDGKEITYLTHGDELAIKGGRGLCEPSLAFFGGKYYLTLRNDARAYVTTSKDGLHFEPVKPWTFDDGKDLGSYNTQAHWLTHSSGLFLSYTRRGANNDHITRHRAPIFVAQVDPDKLQIIRRTEKALLPERGVMLGNFGATAITPQESWVTDAEFIVNGKPHPKGADGTVWLGRVTWSAPNAETSSRFEPIKRAGGPKLKTSLNAYSFNKMLSDHLKGTGKGMSLSELLDFCAEHDFDAIDPTGYYFAGYPKPPSEADLNEFKRRAFVRGLDISGTGVRTHFASADKDKRAADFQLVKDWVEVAARMGAPVLRVFAGAHPDGHAWDEVAEWLVADLKKCVEHGKKHGVIIGIQNHDDFLKTGEQTLKIVKMVDSEWFGVVVDTGAFLTPDPYKDIATVAPFAVNWQIKTHMASKAAKVKTDFKRIVQIAREARYRGYLPIETLPVAGEPYDPLIRVPQALKELRSALLSD